MTPLLARILLLTALALAGCAEMQPRRTPATSPAPVVDLPKSAPAAQLNLSGYPPAFRDGYNDGCASVRGATRRDAKRMKDDSQYASGWQDGYSICKRR